MKAKVNHFRTLAVLAVMLAGVAVALFGVGLRTAEPQTTPTYYKVQDLGTLGGDYSHALDVNDSGQVVGYGRTSIGGYIVPRAFIYDSATQKMLDLGDLGGNYATYANGINDSGKVVGSSHTSAGEQHAFIYDSATQKMQDLNDLIPANSGGTISSASDFNNKGQIAASYFKPFDFTSVDYYVCNYQAPVSGFDNAAVLTPATEATPATYEVRNLGTLGGDYSHALDINDSGKVVGYGQTGTCGEHAFIYDSATQEMLDLGTLGGDYWVATGINDPGQVAGYGLHNGSHAFIYDSATQKMQDLGDLEGGNKSEAMGINDSGQVVGRSYEGASSFITGGGRAFLYDSTNGMQNLNDLIPSDSGWTIYVASAINSNGQIAATGYKEGVGTHALLLTPTSSDIPPPDDSQPPSPPTITSPLNNSYDTDGSFSVSGSAEASSTVELFEGTVSKGTTKADSSSGAWSIALSGVSEGTHTYTVKAKDAAGNTSTVSNSVTVTVDKTPPKVVDGTVVPKEDVTGVAPGVDVKATFTEGMQAASVKSAFKLYKKGTTSALGASVSCDAECRIATLNPSSNLKRGTTYKAVVSTGAKDMAGNSLDQDEILSGSQQKVWFFTVG
jgi:probable HAF family extracellular repeat protein